MENLAGIFNNLVTTYPFSALAAALLLTNWDGHYKVLRRALSRRFGRLGWVISLAISLCALAAILKPALYATLPALGHWFNGRFLLQGSALVDWMSFLFEYLLGVCIQVYLILMVYAWVRGTAFRKAQLLDFAIRRLSYVLKWAGVVMLLSTLCIHLPLILINVPPFSRMLAPDSVFFFHRSLVAAVAGGGADCLFLGADHAHLPQRIAAQGAAGPLQIRLEKLLVARLVPAHRGIAFYPA